MIESVTIFSASIPMQKAFNHAAKERKLTESILIELNSNQGKKGWGEGAPRYYVSGETLKTVIETLKGFNFKLLNSIIKWKNFDEGGTDIFEQNWTYLVNPEVFSPAAAAAVETACIDLLCKIHSRHLADFLNLCLSQSNHSAQRTIPVSLVIDLSVSPRDRLHSLKPEALKQLHCVKIKAHKSVQASISVLREAKALLDPQTYISIDANGAWNDWEISTFAEELRSISWIEEPFKPRQWKHFADIRENYGVKIMLDESFAHERDILQAIEHQACDSVNVRVSKCGGITTSLRLIRKIQQAGLKYQIGVQVGEIGPLWAASRAIAFALDDYLTVEAGRQDEWFPTALTEPPFQINREKSAINCLQSVGFGLSPSSYLLSQLKKIGNFSI
ncbi:dipeptide epimerase [Scytonema sp. NUACC21]